MTDIKTLRKPTMPPAKVPIDVEQSAPHNDVMNKTKTPQHPTNSQPSKNATAKLHREDLKPIVESLDRVDSQLTDIQDAMRSIEKSGENLLKFLSDQKASDDSQAAD